jgi:hypothetical protein
MEAQMATPALPINTAYAGNLPPRRRTGYNLAVLQTVIDSFDRRAPQGETGL